MIMSTGMATDAEIGEALAAVSGTGNDAVVLLHCVSGYPTPVAESNLMRMPRLARQFQTTVGLSDHTPGITVPIAAVALGSALIEKHFTLRRADGGPDAAFSLEPNELRELVESARLAWECLGDGGEHKTPSEAPSLQHRRSLYVVADVEEGEAFAPSNVRSIRPGFGLPPKEIDRVLGRRASRRIDRGTPIDWSMIAQHPTLGP
jgi:N-acetylneuraminate synthase